MLKKIAILLFILLIIQMILYARLYANDIANQVESISKTIRESQFEERKDYDVEDYLKSLGIKTTVDELQLEEKYHGAKLVNDPVDGNTIISFYNPLSNNYRLDVYAVDKGLVASFVNLNSDKVIINKKMFNSGSYLYKLSGESNLYCGTFMLH